ncbi:glycosyltransferase family 2 protein [Bacteroides sp. 224]|uniref:glycosyltransferase n=1 Tax=Bacteroides sp. 224 TaxID=2302936 RepID=UPI0013D37E61|nr:glycosyltransferase [Bacteroides sp. 224]NDV65211.1 glycosyltransferase [Bacteroides sp. 224]
MEILTTVIAIIDGVLFFCMGVSVIYLFIFALASTFKQSTTYPTAKRNHTFAILFPAYKEDKVIESSVSSFLNQNYPKELYDVVVISDQMKDETNEKLLSLDITLLKANYKDSSKAKALQLAMNRLDESKYDAVIIMDGDNLVEPDFLEEVNKVYDTGIIAMQTHRMAKSRSTTTAQLDAVSEEINNSIFRKGHVKLKFSSALIGSGMIFEYKWFKKNIFMTSTAGEDKELEGILLKQRIYVEYLAQVNVYDEKVAKDAAFYNQRRRWIASQYGALLNALPDLPQAISSRNWDYCDKIFQWMMLPRSILILGIGFFSIVTLLYEPALSVKWWLLLIFLGLTLCIAIPRYLIDKNFFHSIVKIPWLAFLMFLNFFRLKGVNKKFIHTDHGEE